MITRVELVNYIDQLLAVKSYEDYAPNGLQIEGKLAIKRICTAVTASLEAVTAAIANKADVLLVHHGYFWRGEASVITGMKKQRLSQFLQHDLNLLAYHLPLDCHKELGNNARLASLFELKAVQSYPIGKIANLLWLGQLAKPLSATQLASMIEEKLGRPPLYLKGSDEQIKVLAFCSGAAQDYLQQAKDLGADAYLSGEVAERTFYEAQELGINYFACGHHATERYGIQALGQHLAEKFNLQHEFIDSANPV